MNNYKKWTGEQREKSLSMTNKAKRMGMLENPKKCRICGQDKGILHSHNINYDVTLQILPKMLNHTATIREIEQVKSVLIPICWRCHMVLHSQKRAPEQCEKYWMEIVRGKKYRPVYYHDFSILKRENGI